MSDELTPITREETYLNAISEGGETGMTPITREEMYLSAIAGETELPSDITPITRREIYLQKIYDNGGAGGSGEAEGTVEINITQNGTITRNVARYASAEITTNVPNPSTGTKEITANGDHDVTDYATAHVAVPQPSGSTSITSNGTHDVTNYASAQVNVPNSYSASDEGKVVSNGALTTQTSRTVTSNGTVDTTLNDEVVVNVPTGITPSGSQTFTENGTYDVTSLAQAVVNVASGGGITKVEGDFTYVEETLGTPIITHNFNTQKIGVLIYPKTTVVALDIYRRIYLEYINTNALCDGDTWTIDLSNYSTGLPQPYDIELPNNELIMGIGAITPSKTANRWNSNWNTAPLNSSSFQLTDNTFQYYKNDYGVRFPAGTWHYIIWKLGD